MFTQKNNMLSVKLHTMKSLSFLFFFITLVSVSFANDSSQLVVYPAPQGALLNDDFVVKVKNPGKDWQVVPNHLVKVDEVRDAKHHVEDASMAFFDFSGNVEVSVTYKKGDISKARVRPLSYGIEPQIKGNTLTFVLDEP